MSLPSLTSLLQRAVITVLFSQALFAQQIKARIAVFPFDDRTTANKDMSIGTKVADLLIAKLASNAAYTVYDRQYVDRILAEKDRKYDPNYDSAAAAKNGLLGTVDMVVAGQIDAFNANAEQRASGMYLKKTVETDGTVVLKVTARMISVEKGSILSAPSANAEQKGVLTKADTYASAVTKHLPGSKDALDVNQQKATSNTDQALRKLVDQAADEVTKQLAVQVAQSAAAMPIQMHAPEAAVKSPSDSSGTIRANFVGVSDGLAYIDKGSAAGVKVGQKFTIQRTIDTGLKNGAGEPIVRHKAVCAIVISTVEETSAAGKCAPDPAVRGPDSVPHPGDDVLTPTK